MNNPGDRLSGAQGAPTSTTTSSLLTVLTTVLNAHEIRGTGHNRRRRQGEHDQPAVADHRWRDGDDLFGGFGRVRHNPLRGEREPDLRGG